VTSIDTTVLPGQPQLTMRPVSAEEFPAFIRVVVELFGEDVNDDDTASDRTVFEPERSLAVFDGDDIVGTTAIFSRRLRVPGGDVPVAGVTMVGVVSTHRRRGVATAMMRRQLSDVHDAGEPVAALWASEAAIYPHFGYGMGTRQALLRVTSADARYRPGVDTGAGQFQQVRLEAAKPALAEIYAAARVHTAGWLDRPPVWWNYELADSEHRRHGATRLRIVVHEDEAGARDGYAVYRVKADWSSEGIKSEVQVRDLAATGPAAYAAIWRYLLDLDLTATVAKRLAAADEPLQHLVADSRSVRLTLGDGLWVRVVDVAAALSARRYSAPIDVVVDTSDDFCPWNAGRYRLSGDDTGAACARTDDPADLTLTSTELGAAYLGGVSLAELAAAGRVREHTLGSLARASTAFSTGRAPWCPEVF